jgi:hypothetical protein
MFTGKHTPAHSSFRSDYGEMLNRCQQLDKVLSTARLPDLQPNPKDMISFDGNQLGYTMAASS